MLDWLLEVIKQNNAMCPTTEAYTDVVELCALLQCLGFSVKSLNTSEGNTSQESGARTVIINCQASGLHVVLESDCSTCSCPPEASQQNSGVWQVSGIAGGQRLDKEFGCSILGSLPKAHRERLSKELHVMMRCIRESGESSDGEKSKEKANKSDSMVEVNVSPEGSHSILKAETPMHYRSLDTLTDAKEDQQSSTPDLVRKQRLRLIYNALISNNDKKRKRIRRQSTYTLPIPVRVQVRNKTSSPLQQPPGTPLEKLIHAEQVAEALRHNIATIIKQLADEGNDDLSISSLDLDVSKTSLLKGSEPLKAQFASSPNLSGMGPVYEDMRKNKLLELETTSSSLVSKKSDKDGGMVSKLRRISPGFFKSKDSSSSKNDKLKPQDSKTSKLNSIFKPKPVTPKFKSESSPNLSASKNKFSHVKSTIPRPTPTKKK